MAAAREKDIKLLVAKFIKLVDSLNPGERLSIRKVAAKKGARAGKRTPASQVADTKGKSAKRG
jgi:hypothetical protein